MQAEHLSIPTLKKFLILKQLARIYDHILMWLFEIRFFVHVTFDILFSFSFVHYVGYIAKYRLGLVSGLDVVCHNIIMYVYECGRGV